MTNEKFTTEEILTMASNLGMEVSGAELTEDQKQELARKITAFIFVADQLIH